MARARPDIGELSRDVVARIEQFRPHCAPIDEGGWYEIESFVAIALRVFAKTNPSKLRDAAMIEEIKARIEGRALE